MWVCMYVQLTVRFWGLCLPGSVILIGGELNTISCYWSLSLPGENIGEREWEGGREGELLRGLNCNLRILHRRMRKVHNAIIDNNMY